jgi:hypothetical protein
MHLQEFAIFNLPNYSLSYTFASGMYALFIFFTLPPNFMHVRNIHAKSSMCVSLRAGGRFFLSCQKFTKSFAKLLEWMFSVLF